MQPFLLRGQATDSLVHALLLDIKKEQVTEDGKFYKGTFPTYRECAGAPHNRQPDNTIFYTAITAFSLRNLLPALPERERKIARQIILDARVAYPGYRNVKGYPYYGFWKPTDPILPHTYYFRFLKEIFGQGEDADDSVMILMTDSSNANDDLVLKKRLEAVANRPQRRILSMYKRYRKYDAYSTYLGSRMTPDFDFAVQCNLMYFVLDKHLPLAHQDSATIQLLADMVRNREYIKDPVFISPYYVKTSILIYHIARLMHAFPLAALEPYRQQLIDDAKMTYVKCPNVMEKLLLSTALMRLGDDAKDYQLSFSSIRQFEESNQKNFIFFQARAAFNYPAPLKKIFLHWSYINYYFYGPAYYKTLWLENMVLSHHLK